MSPLPLAHSRANKKKPKTPTSHSLHASDSPSIRLLQLFHFPYDFPTSLTAFPLPPSPVVRRFKTQEHSCGRNAFSKAEAFPTPKPKRVPRNHPNNKATIMRACPAASQDFQQDFPFLFSAYLPLSSPSRFFKLLSTRNLACLPQYHPCPT